jgi:hypothetical protein
MLDGLNIDDVTGDYVDYYDKNADSGLTVDSISNYLATEEPVTASGKSFKFAKKAR